MTFYGLSNGLWQAEDVSGTKIADNPDGYYAIQNHFDNLTLTLNTGDSIIVSVYGPEGYGRDPSLTDSVAPPAWVLETDSTSAGTVTMAAGVRTASPWMDPASCTEALGSFDCTGQKTVAAAQTSFDLAGYLDGGPTGNVLITVTAGTVVLKQVKLRVWPTSGPAGGWRSGEPWTDTAGSVGYRHSPVGGYGTKYAANDWSDAWAAGRVIFDSAEGATMDAYDDGYHTQAPMTWMYLSSGQPGYDAYFYVNNTTVDIPQHCFATVSTSSVIFVPNQSTASSSPDPGAGYDPNEIAWEDESQIRAIGGGPLVSTVTGWGSATLVQGNAGNVAMAPVSFSPGTSVPFNAPAHSAGPSSSIAMGAGESRTVTPPGSGPFVITGYPDAYFAAPSADTTDFSNGHFTAAPTADLLFGAHEFYDPAYSPPSAITLTSSPAAGEYVYEGDVGATPPPPVLWFCYKRWGFDGDVFEVWGIGLGNTQAALNGKLYISADTAVGADTLLTVSSWTYHAPTAAAYDGTGVIYPGSDSAPPVVDPEAQKLVFTMPTGTALATPNEFELYVVNDNGTSNMVPVLLYPMVDVDMQGADPNNSAKAYTMAMAARPAADPRINQRYSAFSDVAYVLSSDAPERPPFLMTNAVPAMTLTGGSATDSLDDPVDVVVPMAQRYRPLDSTQTPRPDLGTGVTVWDPSTGAGNGWKYYVDSAPFIDSAQTIESRVGEIVRPAMIFPGDAWLELLNTIPSGPIFTLAMAVQVYPDPQPRTYLMSSFVSGAPDPDSYPFELYLEGDTLTLKIGTKISSFTLAPGYVGRRPFIVGIALSQSLVTITVTSASTETRSFWHSPMTINGLKLYLGRSNDAGNMQLAQMDILDMGFTPGAAFSTTQLQTVVNAFDTAYGVKQ